MNSISNKQGFTLVEMMIVVAIISMLASIAVPNLQEARHRAYHTKWKAWVRAVSTAIEAYSADTGQYPTNITSLTSTTPPYLNQQEAALCNTTTSEGYLTQCYFFYLGQIYKVLAFNTEITWSSYGHALRDNDFTQYGIFFKKGTRIEYEWYAGTNLTAGN